jgi:hypothetical protein
VLRTRAHNHKGHTILYTFLFLCFYMQTPLCAHRFCGSRVKKKSKFAWGLKCNHLFHLRCMTKENHKALRCSTCGTLAPLQLWNPDAEKGKCFLPECRGMHPPEPVCVGCRPAFNARIRNIIQTAFRESDTPVSMVEVITAFFSRATLLPEWFRSPAADIAAITAVQQAMEAKQPIHPVVASLWTCSVKYITTSPYVVFDPSNNLVWPTEQYYVHLLNQLPIAEYTVRSITQSSSIQLTQCTEREHIFSTFARTHESHGVTMYKGSSATGVFYRKKTKHAITSRPTLIRALKKQGYQGVLLKELWAEHVDVAKWIEELIASGDFLKLENRVFATDSISSLPGVDLTLTNPNIIKVVSTLTSTPHS